jgi:hypothetical protein
MPGMHARRACATTERQGRRMTQRWHKPTAKTPQLGLALPRGALTPAGRDTTDTSAAAAASVGLKRGGDKDAMAVENVGDLANAMLGAMKRHTRKTRFKAVMFALTVRKEVLDYLGEHPEGATADEIAAAIKRSPFTVRPRVSELNKKMNLIVDTGARRANASSGRAAIVWRKA